MGLLEGLSGEQIKMGCSPNRDYYGFRDIANQRLGNGPIDWAKILSNQYRALALTRPLTSFEQYLYDSALEGIHKAQLEAKS